MLFNKQTKVPEKKIDEYIYVLGTRKDFINMIWNLECLWKRLIQLYKIIKLLKRLRQDKLV